MSGLIAMGRHQYQEAMAQFDESIKLRPSSVFGHLWFGRAAFNAKAYAEARAAFEKAVKLDQNSKDAKIWLGRSLMQAGELGKAGSLLSEAVDQRPDDPSLLEALMRVRAVQAKEQKDPEVSMRFFGEALGLAEKTIRAAEKVDDSNIVKRARRSRAEIWNNLAYRYMVRGGPLSVAMEYINRALDSWPEDAVFLSTKAEILIKLAERQAGTAEGEVMLTQAERLIKSAFDDKTQNNRIVAEFWVDLGRIEKLRGHHEAANRDFLKALDLDPTNADARKLAQ